MVKSQRADVDAGDGNSPTVAGPMMVTPFWSAVLISFLVRFSGMPSAMMAIVRI